ncbi:hypothetical protein GCM10023201_45500 [Actinomycetospora corticicola]|uniref:HEAT repeat protein n=1 Tax=Actinomycetospora corticicola TaxID=663602 RepID=A0A7Y9J819_9PSEU|nr:hypothetical protein [Actinomycetospora corticicola]NYD39097.1 hypothetical protein [Actinomycetospora corticicola]
MERYLLLSGAAIAILVLGTATIWAVRRTRQGAQQLARRGAAARRRVATAADRADAATDTLEVADRFGAGGPLLLTAEPQPGDLLYAVAAPSPPFDLTAPGAADALQDWEAASPARRRTVLIRGYLAHPLPRVRGEALDLIGRFGGEDARVPWHLAALLRDDAGSVRRKAAALAWSGDVDAVVAVLRERPDPDAGRAHAALVEHAPDGREAPPLR